MTNNESKHQGWVASLSNGETVLETAPVPGERTAWGKLQERCQEEGLFVTQIQLQIDGNTWVGMKNADGYCFFRDMQVGGYVSGNVGERHWAGIGSVVGDTVYCTLVDAGLNSQADTRPLDRMLAHCVLKPDRQRRIQEARDFLADQTAKLERDLAILGGGELAKNFGNEP